MRYPGRIVRRYSPFFNADFNFIELQTVPSPLAQKEPLAFLTRLAIFTQEER